MQTEPPNAERGSFVSQLGSFAIRSTVILIELRWIFLLLRRQLSAKMEYAYARIIRAPVHRRKRLEQIALGGKKANVLSRIIC